MNAKYLELLHDTVSLKTSISQNIACKIIQAWFDYKKDLIGVDVAQQVLADTQGMQKAIDTIKQQQRSYLLLDDEVTVLETYYIMIKLLESHEKVVLEFEVDKNSKPVDFVILLEWIRISEQVIKI